MYGPLIAIGIVMVQPFLTAPSLDLSATICVVAFSVAIPILAALMLVSRQEAFRGRRTNLVLVAIGQAVGQATAFAGVVAGFWHILWIAGVLALVAGVIGMAIHSAGHWRLELDESAASDEGNNPSATFHGNEDSSDQGALADDA